MYRLYVVDLERYIIGISLATAQIYKRTLSRVLKWHDFGIASVSNFQNLSMEKSKLFDIIYRTALYIRLYALSLCMYLTITMFTVYTLVFGIWYFLASIYNKYDIITIAKYIAICATRKTMTYTSFYYTQHVRTCM